MKHLRVKYLFLGGFIVFVYVMMFRSAEQTPVWYIHLIPGTFVVLVILMDLIGHRCPECRAYWALVPDPESDHPSKKREGYVRFECRYCGEPTYKREGKGGAAGGGP